MRLVVDANIIFSALLNPESSVGIVLMDFANEYEFFAPELVLSEITRYNDKILKYTKLNETKVEIIKTEIFKTIKVISEDLISQENWHKAFELTSAIDENDTPFIALALELNTKLWTGDKKLLNGLPEYTVSTQKMLE